MIKKVVTDKLILQQKSSPATEADAQVITDLMDTLRANQAACVGMAANMIGVLKQIIVVQVGPMIIPMVNPKITSKQGKYHTTEGCLSLIGERLTDRFRKITVSYLDQNFVQHKETFSGFTAQIIQHEIDHCQGILI